MSGVGREGEELEYCGFFWDDLGRSGTIWDDLGQSGVEGLRGAGQRTGVDNVRWPTSAPPHGVCGVARKALDGDSSTSPPRATAVQVQGRDMHWTFVRRTLT